MQIHAVVEPQHASLREHALCMSLLPFYALHLPLCILYVMICFIIYVYYRFVLPFDAHACATGAMHVTHLLPGHHWAHIHACTISHKCADTSAMLTRDAQLASCAW